MKLPDFLREQAVKPFVYGESDCCMMIADWIKIRRRTDLAYSRGRYKSEEEARRFYTMRGGLARVVGRAFLKAKIRMTRRPMAGDVGVIQISNKVICAIRTPSGWIVRLESGLAYFRSDVVRMIAAWRV